MIQINQQPLKTRPIQCPYKNKAMDVCFSHKCDKKAFRCHVQNCQCSNIDHSTCQLLSLKPLLAKLQNKKNDISNQRKKALKQVYEICQQMIRKLQADLAEICSKMEYAGLQKNQKIFMEYIQKGQHQDIKGKLVQKVKQEFDELEDQKEGKIHQSAIKKQKYYNEAEIKAIWQTDKNKFEDLRTNLLTFLHPITLESVITKDEKLIKEFLVAPNAKFKLLYRASENNYEAAKFHQKCDKKPNTLVIVQTQFKKVIGGYTPLTWDVANHGKNTADTTSKSFLFSLTNKEKYPIQNKQYAIYNHSGLGPTFGGGSDLRIYDKSNISNSWANFPHSYNNGRYTKNQSSYQAFSGATSNQYFKTDEWQVYEVQLT